MATYLLMTGARHQFKRVYARKVTVFYNICNRASCRALRSLEVIRLSSLPASQPPTIHCTLARRLPSLCNVTYFIPEQFYYEGPRTFISHVTVCCHVTDDRDRGEAAIFPVLPAEKLRRRL